MSKVLLDTCVIIDFLRIKDKKNSTLFKLANQENDLAISLISHTELYAGKSVWTNQSAQDSLKTILSGIEVINFNQKISRLAGKLRARNGIDLIDAIIAATAINYQLPLATLNNKHFSGITGLDLADY